MQKARKSRVRKYPGDVLGRVKSDETLEGSLSVQSIYTTELS